MLTEIRTVYLRELRSQCIIGHQAIADMASLTVPAHIESELTSDLGAASSRFWYCLQAFLASAANISKLLWPSPHDGKDAATRGSDLRTLIATKAVAPGSALDSSGRDLRNAFEHFDARLDEWARSARARGDFSIIVRVLWAGPPKVFGVQEDDCYLYFDASSYHVWVAGKEYEIMPLSWEIYALVDRIDDLLGTPAPQRLPAPDHP
jgi:hypothetical protein